MTKAETRNPKRETQQRGEGFPRMPHSTYRLRVLP